MRGSARQGLAATCVRGASQLIRKTLTGGTTTTTTTTSASTSASSAVSSSCSSMASSSSSLGQRRCMGGGGPPGGFWSEGTKAKPDGLLFGETPPPPGMKRKWESWEAPWYATLVASAVLLTVGLSAKPDNGIVSWAKEEAMQRRYGKE
mmetsp:Transcript_6857/g.12578  ORF Transcript_6857/g.12578 Transcript_6857/m.12578 type:complete len:149 (+) Transcript_6857:277-723(+)